MSWLDQLRVTPNEVPVAPRVGGKVGLVELKTWQEDGNELVIRGKLGSLETAREGVDITTWRSSQVTYILGPTVTTATIMSMSGEIWPEESDDQPV